MNDYEKDTVRLMRQCDSGVKMGISYLSDIIPLAVSSAQPKEPARK